MKACGRGGRHSLDPGSRLASIREASGGGGLSDGWIISRGLDLFLVSVVSSARHCGGGRVWVSHFNPPHALRCRVLAGNRIRLASESFSLGRRGKAFIETQGFRAHPDWL